MVSPHLPTTQWQQTWKNDRRYHGGFCCYLPCGFLPASTSTLSAGKSSHAARHFFLEPTVTAIWGAISCDESGGSPWFLSWGLLIRVFLRGGWGGGAKYWGSKLLLCNHSLTQITFERRSWAFSVTNVTRYLVVFSKGNSEMESTQTGQRIISPQIEGTCAVFGNALEFLKHFSSGGLN